MRKYVILSALVLTRPMFGLAQGVPADLGGGKLTTGGLEEIVVTAQRRSENLQDVPIAVSVVTAQALRTAQVTDTTSLSLLVPGLDFTQQNDGATPFLRGVGSASGGVGNESSVAIYMTGSISHHRRHQSSHLTTLIVSKY